MALADKLQAKIDAVQSAVELAQDARPYCRTELTDPDILWKPSLAFASACSIDETRAVESLRNLRLQFEVWKEQAALVITGELFLVRWDAVGSQLGETAVQLGGLFEDISLTGRLEQAASELAETAGEVATVTVSLAPLILTVVGLFLALQLFGRRA